MKRASLLTLLGVQAVVLVGAAGAGEARFPPFGLDLAAEDRNVRPGDDFFRYANGNWLATTQVPADRVRWGSFDELREKSEGEVRALIEALTAHPAEPGSNAQKIADYYRAFLDTEGIERLGLGPLKGALLRIEAARKHEDIAALMATPGLPLAGPISADIGLDEKNPDRYVVYVGHSGLSLPDREYYLKDAPQFKEIRSAFREHVRRMLSLAQHADAAAEADRILALETAIARLHWDRARRRQRELTYNLATVAELERAAPAYPWRAALGAAGLTQVTSVVIQEQSAIAPLGKLFRRTPVAVWKSYLDYQLLRNEAAVLPKAFDAESFDFYGHKLNGQPEQRQRWKRAVAATNQALGEAVGELYVARHFPPESKAAMQALVENLRKSYAHHISTVPWMTPETRRLALEKLQAFRSKIGYPDRWRDYARLEVRPGDAFGNRRRAEIFEWERQLARLDKPTDRAEWQMTPQTVNAYYNPVFNEIVFPAAILQPPFFDPNADAAVNYGAIGSVIGHEMGHGFDDQGAKSDAKGVLRSWWRAEDVQAFKRLTERLADQYSQFEPLPGLHLNGRLTLGENIGDLGGMSIAHDAYLISLGGQPAPVLEGLSPEQRFFLGQAQVCRVLQRAQSLRNQILTDPHSPGQYRVNGVVRNIDAWYTAFDVQPGDRLYLPPEQRVHIW